MSGSGQGPVGGDLTASPTALGITRAANGKSTPLHTHLHGIEPLEEIMTSLADISRVGEARQGLGSGWAGQEP